MARCRRPRKPIMIKEHVVIDGLPVGALRTVFPGDPAYEAHYREVVRFKGAYPYGYATDEDIGLERSGAAHDRSSAEALASTPASRQEIDCPCRHSQKPHGRAENGLYGLVNTRYEVSSTPFIDA
jgi:hypothetical protein